MRLLISGYRNYDSREDILDAILYLTRTPHLIIGDCPTGVDRIVREIADEMKWPYTMFFADWKTYGKAAGPIRNRAMIEEGKPDHALLFISTKSRGTKNMMSLLDTKKVPYRAINIL